MVVCCRGLGEQCDEIAALLLVAAYPPPTVSSWEKIHWLVGIVVVRVTTS